MEVETTTTATAEVVVTKATKKEGVSDGNGKAGREGK